MTLQHLEEAEAGHAASVLLSKTAERVDRERAAQLAAQVIAKQMEKK